MQNLFLFVRELGSLFYFGSLSFIYSLGLYLFYLRTRNRGLNVSWALDIGLLIMVFGFVGARLFHVVYEYPDYYQRDPWRVLQFWQGGFVFYGGALAAFGAYLIFMKVRGLATEEWADVIAPVLIFGYGLGRVVGFLAGSSFGSPTTAPWAVVYPEGFEAPPFTPLHPAALYEAVWSFTSVAALLWMESRKSKMTSRVGGVFYLTFVLHGIGRIVLEMFRGDYRGPLIFGFSISTWIAAVIFSWGALNLVHKTCSE